MMPPSSDRTPCGPLTQETAAVLAAELTGEMIERWRQGERPLPEDFLARHPQLWEHPEAAADLIYEELCLRQEHGVEVPLEQVLSRFPQWRPQLAVLFDCQRLLGPRYQPPQFPAAGECLGDFVLLAELGRGAHARVFLASQLSLADRPVVLKLTPCEAREHLSLARLQHTHIVPLYSVQDHLARGLRALCMPFFGSVTLGQLLERLRPQPPGRRTGQDVLDALKDLERGVRSAERGAENALIVPRSALRAPRFPSYVQAVCWLGACLADGLQYAHERGLVHLDVKPSNVLLATDGQPMLLDFHLAREPVRPGSGEPHWLGGTTGYMSPEQQAALRAIQEGREVTLPVDGRSDVYSLGVVLYEALGGSLPPLPSPGGVGKPRPLHRCNPQVSVGLADVVGKCLAGDPGDRYADMAAVAADLRRHLAHQPLSGVRNRSLVERWRKWRRRRPHGVALAGMLLAVVTAAGAVALGAASHGIQRIEEARTALNDGQVQMAEGQWEGAIRTLQRGSSAARGVPFQGRLIDELDYRLRLAERGRAAANRSAAVGELHRLADRVRFLYGVDPLPPEELRGLEACCRVFWEGRGRLVERLGPAVDAVVRGDLLDLAIFWADLQVRLAPPLGKGEGRRQALTVLAEAEALCGPSPVLDAEARLHGGRVPGRGLQSSPSRLFSQGKGLEALAWEHYALGRSYLRSGDLGRAADEVGRAVRLQPQGLWPNFYQGVCAYRLGRYADAATAYSVCIGVAPEAAGCFYNRALAFAALDRTEQALDDYDQALRLDPTLAAAALDNLGRALRHNPDQPDARKLYDRLRDGERRLGAVPSGSGPCGPAENP